MLIRLHHEGDFNRLWKKEIWHVDSFPMRVFIWTLSFRSDVESSIVLIWVSFPNLHLSLFNKQCLFSITCMIGSSLTIDMPTTELSRPSIAKVCMQIDLLKKASFNSLARM